MQSRLPAHLEISAMIRLAEAEGGFATVLAKGEKEAGTILLLTVGSDRMGCLYERMPQLDGTRPFLVAKQQTTENKQEFEEYLKRRQSQDPDLWILELDIVDSERFIASFQC